MQDAGSLPIRSTSCDSLVPPSYAARLGCSPLVSLTSAGEKAWEPFIANFTAAVDCDPINTVTVYINQARPTFRQRLSPQSVLCRLCNIVAPDVAHSLVRAD